MRLKSFNLLNALSMRPSAGEPAPVEMVGRDNGKLSEGSLRRHAYRYDCG
jgi:hypothetical protein